MGPGVDIMLRSKTDIWNLGIPVALEDSKKDFSAA